MRLFVVFGAFFLTGCGLIQQAFPNEPQAYATERGTSVSVRGAPKGSLVYVNGREMGEISGLEGGPHILRLAPGIHKIKVVKNDRILVERELGLGSAPKEIVVRSP